MDLHFCLGKEKLGHDVVEEHLTSVQEHDSDGRCRFYLPFCEYNATKSAANNDSAPRSWWKYIPLVAGAWLKEENITSPLSANIGYV